MKYSEGKIGRIFVLRLNDGDELPGCIERFAEEKKISLAQAVLVGGIGSGKIVAGPRHNRELPIDPMLIPVDGVHELVGLGVLAPDKDGLPSLHIHAALGRAGATITGCLRTGVKTWLVGEVILCEILGVSMARLPDESSGFDLLTKTDT
ncbi:MAG: DNA-binding protein [Dehalococcoidia bacterium]|nr:DNA-binding protein [Dehalococcoidia bacterium]